MGKRQRERCGCHWEHGWEPLCTFWGKFVRGRGVVGIGFDQNDTPHAERGVHNVVPVEDMLHTVHNTGSCIYSKGQEDRCT
jgi:hypothetical protein